MLLILIIVLLIFAFGGGAFGLHGGYSWGTPGIGLGGVLLVILILLLLTGRL